MTHHYLEYERRSYEGRTASKDDWDMDVVMTVRELAEEFDIPAACGGAVPTDEALLDRLFLAGVEMLKRTGMYNISTGRVIEFSKDEIEDALKSAPQQIVMGEGDGARTLFPRVAEDTRPPLAWAGNPGVPTNERYFLPTVKSWMKEPLIDMATCGSLVDVDGYPVRLGEPSELYATKRELTLLRRALKEVGRPGMGLLAAESAVSEVGDLAVAHPDYLRRCDSHLVVISNELVISRDNMLRAASSTEYGMKNVSLVCTMVGGLAGGAPGAVVAHIAQVIAGRLICLADYHLCHPIHINHTATSTRECMWLQSAVCQAFARNAPYIIFGDIYPKSGAMTRELLYETAANAIAITVSGGHLEGVGSADGFLPNGTGLECRLMAQTGRAVCAQGISRKEADGLIQSILGLYEHVFGIKGGNPGKPFQEAYDADSVTPVPEWAAMYDECREKLYSLGLKL